MPKHCTAFLCLCLALWGSNSRPVLARRDRVLMPKVKQYLCFNQPTTTQGRGKNPLDAKVIFFGPPTINAWKVGAADSELKLDLNGGEDSSCTQEKVLKVGARVRVKTWPCSHLERVRRFFSENACEIGVSDWKAHDFRISVR